MSQFVQSLKTLILALILSIGVSYVYAWTGPTATGPNGNMPAPINVGATSQVKLGGLGVANFIANSVAVGPTVNASSITAPKFCIGTSCITVWPAPPPPPSGSKMWDTPGSYTWTVPSGVTSVTATVVGGGAGGGGGWFCGDCHTSGGGGSGGKIVKQVYTVTPGQKINVTVGSGGAGSSWGCGPGVSQSGAVSTFGSLQSSGGVGTNAIYSGGAGGTPAGVAGCSGAPYAYFSSCGGNNGTGYGTGGNGIGCYGTGGTGTGGVVDISWGQ